MDKNKLSKSDIMTDKKAEMSQAMKEKLAPKKFVKNPINGTKYNFGLNNQNIVLDGDPILIKPGSNYKIIFNTEDSLPNTYELLNENFTSIPVSIEDNEYYLDATFKKLFIRVE